MNEEEVKEIVRKIAASPAFMTALMTCKKNLIGHPNNFDLAEIGLWFFSQGFLEAIELQKMTSPVSFYGEAIADGIQKVKDGDKVFLKQRGQGKKNDR